jgi:hypothetical protein
LRCKYFDLTVLLITRMKKEEKPVHLLWINLLKIAKCAR